jgi:trans-aconitate methyltransferase
MKRREHWDKVFQAKLPHEVTWFQARPEASLELIARCHLPPEAGILDVGGGTSTLVDELLDRGFDSVGVLDVSEKALSTSRDRLGRRADQVEWYAEDVTRFRRSRHWALWHDRALFHFLTDESDRVAYKEALGRALSPGGYVIIAAFAPTGPSKCSGLDVVRYSAESLQKELGRGYVWLESLEDSHLTPSGGTQDFLFSLFRRVG